MYDKLYCVYFAVCTCNKSVEFRPISAANPLSSFQILFHIPQFFKTQSPDLRLKDQQATVKSESLHMVQSRPCIPY